MEQTCAESEIAYGVVVTIFGLKLALQPLKKKYALNSMNVCIMSEIRT